MFLKLNAVSQYTSGRRARVYLIGEPGVDEGGHRGRGGPRARGGGEMVFEPAQLRIEAIGDGGFEQAAEAFDRIEFRAVGRQRQQLQIYRQADIIDGQMKAGLIGDDHMKRCGVGVGDLTQKERVDIAVDGRSEQQFGCVRAIHFQGLAQVTPLVTRRVGRMHPHAAAALDPADHRQQSVTMLVEHPHPHGLRRRRTGYLLQPRGQFRFKLCRFDRVLFRVRLARDF